MCPSFSWNYFPFVAIWDHPICLTRNTSRSLSHWPPLAKKKKKSAIESMIFHFAKVAHLLFISVLWFHLHSCLLKVRVIKAQAWCPYHSARAEAPIVSMTHTGLLERLQPNAKEEKGGRIWALTERITELLTVMSVGLMTYLCSICHIL